MLKIGELFTGTGAFSLAFHEADPCKFSTIYANDFEPASKKIFDENNTNIALTLKDLTMIEACDVPQMDILTAGFPCQPFSIAGLQEGFKDPRSNVFWKIVEIIQHHRPRVVLLENVKNLQSHDNGNTFGTIKNSLENEGYFVKYAVLNTCTHTVIPQNRERIYIVCFREKDDFERFEFPSKRDLANLSVNDFIMPCDQVHDKYYYKENCQIYEKLAKDVVEDISQNTVYQYRRYYIRQNKSGVCPTLTANMGTGGHNVPIIKDGRGIRKLTPRECFNLQGFPQEFVLPSSLSDAKLYKLAGNAVSVPIVKEIALALAHIL
jgi:DNA (cytosine-5)-methyltransferase 1